MINIKDFDFQDLPDPASNIHDVEFKIVDENSQEQGIVRFHKFLLFILSPVLKKMFMNREEGSIVVEITSLVSRPSSSSDVCSIDYLFDLYVQLYALLIICLICMFRCILYWLSVWSLCSDVCSIYD